MIPFKVFWYAFGGILAAVAIIVIFWKKDEILSAFYDKKTASSEAHGDSATTFIAGADTTHAAGVLLRNDFDALTRSSEIRSNPGAVRVAAAGRTVMVSDSTEIKKLRLGIGQLEAQVHDLETRPEKPKPRAIPYVEPLYSFSSSGRARPLLRAGIDYRVIGVVSAKVEASYEPPPTGEDRPAEFRLNVGGRITFR